MELWIRSQDKMKLTRVINIGIFEEQEGYTIYYDYDIDNMLGTYATKERALEVLDEIQNILKPQMILSKVGKPIAETCDGLVYGEPDEYEIKELSTYVYKMPID